MASMTPPSEHDAPPGLFGRLRASLARALDGGRGVPAKGSEYVVGLDTRDTQFMVPNQALTVKLPIEPGQALRWVWEEQTCFEINPIARPATETAPDGQAFDVWRFRTTGEKGVCFLRFRRLDPARPELPPAQSFTLTVKVGGY